MLLMIMAGTWAGLALFAPPDAPWPTARQTAPLALTLGMLVASWSGIAMALGAAYRRGAASGTTALLAFAALLLDWAHRLWPPLDRIAWLSPFFYFNPYELVAGGPLASGEPPGARGDGHDRITKTRNPEPEPPPLAPGQAQPEQGGVGAGVPPGPSKSYDLARQGRSAGDRRRSHRQRGQKTRCIYFA